MAIILKQEKSFVNGHELSIPTAYGVIDQCNGNKKEKVQYFTLEIYASKQARDNKAQVIEQYNYNVTEEGLKDKDGQVIVGSKWSDWFDVLMLKVEDIDTYKKAYEYVLWLTDVKGDKVWGDWRSDEI